MAAAEPIEVVEHRDPSGRRFTFAPVDHPGADGMGIHFSAFFGAWGNARPYRADFQGYFHRRKMLGTDETHDWLFLCDPYGAKDNGCYYVGQAGDPFVERATRAIIEGELARRGHRPDRVVTLGSSMGATGALVQGLDLDVAGIVAIGPHIDLDTSARMQDRMAEVAWICPDGDPLAAHNAEWTRRIERRLDERPADRPLPRLYLQSCADDHGVHEEQVLPLAARWRRLGGHVDLDVRPTGGHTSDYATRALLLEVTRAHLAGEAVDVDRLQHDPAFAGPGYRTPLQHRIRRRASLIRASIIGR